MREQNLCFGNFWMFNGILNSWVLLLVSLLVYFLNKTLVVFIGVYFLVVFDKF